MIISYKWLSEYLPEPVPVGKMSEILTSIGLEVEEIEHIEVINGSLVGLVIAEILTCERHPNADKLSITTVNTGEIEPLKIVCGAPNVAAGQKVVVAPVGTTVHPTGGEPFLIKKAKIRGEESNGMICAEDEIGLGNSHAGIMVLPEDAPVGMLAKDYFKIPEPDYAIHIGLTPNRSDAMSHVGVARDVCAYLTHHEGNIYDVQLPVTELPQTGEAQQSVAVNISAPEACPRYTGVSISGIKVAPSPDWIQQRLKAIGVRAINNIVDITNYVLHEYGQPLHAFDADKIAGNTINVQFLPQGSSFVTLDEKERKLNSNDLMICDASEGMCIAGVFGGIKSGVTDNTTNIFLESAYFDPKHIRRTSMFHGLRTDAATHFEKGVDINNVIPALERAAAMIVEIAGGSIASGVIDVYPQPVEPTEITVSYEYINRLSGKNYEKIAVKNILLSLDFAIEKETEDSLLLLVPTNKTDVKQPADIVEEILRIDGLDNITIPERLSISLNRPMPNDRSDRNHLADLLAGIGFREIVTNSIVNSKYYPGRTDLVKMLNSLSSELDVLRPSMLESGLEVIQYNCNRKNNNLALYEFGKVYTRAGDKYVEEYQLAIYITGEVQAANWNTKPQKADIFYTKGIVESLINRFGLHKVTATHTGDGISWKWKNESLCSVAVVPAKTLQEFDIRQDVFFAIIHWEVWRKAMAANAVRYKEVAKFPAVQRDLALILDKNVTYEQVQQATEQLKMESLQSFGLFDVFESEKLGEGKKSYALNYTFQLQDRTLTDAEIEQVMQQLISQYKNKLGAQIRE